VGIPGFEKSKKYLRSNLPCVKERAWKNGSDTVARIIPLGKSMKLEKLL
jgi:hypothetical protein